MKNKNLIRFAFGLIALPTLVAPTGVIPQVNAPQSVLVQKMNNGVGSLLALNQATDDKTKTLQLQADTIDAFLTKRGSRLAGLGMDFAREADKNGIDYRLLVSIAGRESTFARDACDKYPKNWVGWGSCHISFDSDEQAIETLSRHLGGNDDATDQYYEGKTTYQILRKYNTVIKKYPEQVIRIMNMIGPEDVNNPDGTPTDTTNQKTTA